MKKRMILLVLLFGVVSFSKTGVIGTQTRSKNNFSTKVIGVKNEESAVNKALVILKILKILDGNIRKKIVKILRKRQMK